MLRKVSSIILLFYFSISVLLTQSNNPFEIYKKGESVPILISKTASSEGDITAVLPYSNPFDVAEGRNAAIITETNTNKRTVVTKKLTNYFPSTGSNGFIFWILLFNLILLAFAISIDRKTFSNLYRSILNNNFQNVIKREHKGGMSLFMIILYISFIFNISLFCLQALSYYSGVKGLNLFFLMILVWLSVYPVRHISLWILQQLLPNLSISSNYSFSIVIFNCILGLLLFPINVLIAYSPYIKQFILFGLFIILLCYVLRQIKAFFLALGSRHVNFFHFFIYLCTFEIAPLLLGIKLVSSYLNGI